MKTMLLLVVITFGSAVTELTAQEDGVYEVLPKGGVGNAVTLTVLGGQISSGNNSNDEWHLFVKYPQEGFLPGNRYCVFLEGRKKSIYGWGSDGTPSYDFSLGLTTSEAKRASAMLGIPLLARAHPGHRIDGTFSTDKAAYAPGELIVVTLKIRNVSNSPFYFTQGGRQRGPRDDQFTFFGRGPQGTLAVKDAMNFGGILRVITVPPNEEVLITAELNSWLDTDKPGTYWVFGSYLLPIHQTDAQAHNPTWEDYITRPFSFEVKERK